MKPVNPVSEKDRAEAKRLYDSLASRLQTAPYFIDDPEKIARALADARAEGYVAGVEDAAKVARGYKLFNPQGVQIGSGEPVADAFEETLIGPKKEGGG